MRRIATESISGNEVLAKDLFSADGKFIMSAGSFLRPEHIKIFQGFNVTHILIESEEIVFEDSIEKKIQLQCCSRVCEVIETYSHCGSVELSEIVEIAENIMTDILSSHEIMYNVCYIREKSMSTYSHSINVCAMSVLIALRMKLSVARVKDMAVGALLHDIGYAYLPKGYTNKIYENCTDREKRELRKHVINGYSAVEDEEWLPQIAKEIILCHHEYCDGSGYPLHHSHEKMKREYRIVSLCNEFDSCVSGHYRKSMKVHEVIDYIISQAGKKFDFDVVRIFAATVAVYPVGTYVCTDKGEIGVVIRQNANLPLRPVLCMKYDSDGKTYEEQVIVDMLEELSVKIIDTVDNLPE